MKSLISLTKTLDETNVQKIILKKEPLISVVMPAYNEGEHIAEAIGQISGQLNVNGHRFEIIVVDDGSKDDTYNIVNKLNTKNLHTIRLRNNSGKGIALKQGLEHAKGEYVLFVDSDMEISAKNIDNYIDTLKTHDIVIASKRHPDSIYHAPLLRKFLSTAFQTLVSILVGVKATDTQSGLKAGRAEPLKKIFSLLAVKRYAFDVEMLTLANLLRYTYTEMPVDIKLKAWFNPIEALRMLKDLLGIAYRLRIRQWYQRNILLLSP